ncbi:hypothetical protein CEXT_435591 [Caerostris extrusa]|uniref:Uncharacterized protein n=1 Tax=Caerostris extrusa TaxID=172846 RepID=A0AAV4V009_CAEEX|nr:hypothetical protein CEXT_435591 [Caerostris extrusa]
MMTKFPNGYKEHCEVQYFLRRVILNLGNSLTFQGYWEIHCLFAAIGKSTFSAIPSLRSIWTRKALSLTYGMWSLILSPLELRPLGWPLIYLLSSARGNSRRVKQPPRCELKFYYLPPPHPLRSDSSRLA